MKKILNLILVLLALTLASCTNLNSPNSLLEFEGVLFEDENVVYDGKLHTIEVSGAPSFALVEYDNEGVAEDIQECWEKWFEEKFGENWDEV